jgi:gliding motility-associated-like protein
LVIDTSYILDSVYATQLDSVWLSRDSLNCADLGTVQVTIYVTDTSGLIDSCTANVTVIDTIAPAFNCLPNNEAITENENCEFTVPDYTANLQNVWDNCDTLNVTFSQTPLPGSIIYINNTTLPINIVASDGSGNTSICDFDVEIDCKHKFRIPVGFSPNDDGTNDKFVIEGIEDYPNNSFKVLNRWGNKVYETKGYLNEWDGTNTQGISFGETDLPVGTYFFILDLGEDMPEGEERMYKGYIYLSR